MISARLLSVVLVAALHQGDGAVLRGKTTANPIRKVVNMLQSMQQKVSEEGETEKKLYDKFMCYCKTGGSDLSASIAAAQAKLGQLATDIESAEAKHTKTKDELKSAQTDRAAGEQAMKEATALREKEAATYAQFKADSDANLAAISKAVASIESGMAGGFLQTSTAGVLRRIVAKAQNLVEYDRQTLVAFLSGSTDYAPQSGQIAGILKTMHDEMSAGLAEATSSENSAITIYNQLMESKLKEKAALTDTIESKLARIGELGVSIAEMKNDAGDTAEAFSADQKFLAELNRGCASKTADWEERSKTRAAELVALADTIKILNDDDALELFKKTLPSASGFMQVQVGSRSVRASAIAALRQGFKQASPGERVQLDLISMALHGNARGFEKVISMIDKMVATLKKEQVDDDSKKVYCSTQLDKADDTRKGLERKISNLDTNVATAKDSISTLAEEIAALTAGISSLDKSVAEATANRKAEHAEYSELIASNSAAKEVLNMAVNRLNTFYNPKLAKPAAPALIQLMNHKDVPAPPPATYGAYLKKGGESQGVVEMIKLLIKDLDKEMTEAETEEKDAQADYESLMQDSAAKRVADSKSLSEKTAAKADTEAALETHNDDKAATTRELLINSRYIASLHTECDWLMKYFDARQAARASEIDSLQNAKAVLSGASFA